MTVISNLQYEANQLISVNRNTVNDKLRHFDLMTECVSNLKGYLITNYDGIHAYFIRIGETMQNESDPREIPFQDL